jgi:hypothetical protein
MLVGVLLIVLGLATVFWGRWLLPRQLKSVQNKMQLDQRKRFDAVLQRRSVRKVFALPAVCGLVAIITGVAFLLMR